MGTRFRGWPEQAYPVLLKLGGEPSRETRERVRRHREEHVRQPMIDLLNDLADVDPWYEDFAVWRYASTAYWWQNQRDGRSGPAVSAQETASVRVCGRFLTPGTSAMAATSTRSRPLTSDRLRTTLVTMSRACAQTPASPRCGETMVRQH
jgi:hypothetical protein